MKKVLIISASPRKGGNSDLLCDELRAARPKPGTKWRRSVSPKRRSATAPAVTPVRN